jgi:hypothetical protein
MNAIVSPQDMANFLRENGTACRFVSLISDTEPRLRKDCPFQGVRKISRKTGLVNVNYLAACERGIAAQLGVDASEIDYAPGETWHAPELTEDGKALPISQHRDAAKRTGAGYLRFFPRRSVDTYVDGSGQTIAEETLAPYFYAKGERKEWKPCFITIGLENVRELRASGQILTASDVQDAEKVANNLSALYDVRDYFDALYDIRETLDRKPE